MQLLPHQARRRTKMGTVVSDKMEKTVVVVVENFKRHRLYGRSVRRTKKYHAHDEENRCKIGDKVVISESRPLSKTKRWSVREVIGHDVVAALPKVDESDIAAPPPKIDPSTLPLTPPRAAVEQDGGSPSSVDNAGADEE